MVKAPRFTTEFVPDVGALPLTEIDKPVMVPVTLTAPPLPAVDVPDIVTGPAVEVIFAWEVEPPTRTAKLAVELAEFVLAVLVVPVNVTPNIPLILIALLA
jgi:hypothetical protein